MSIASLRAAVRRGITKDPVTLTFSRGTEALQSGGGYRTSGSPDVFTETVLVYEKREPVLVPAESGVSMRQAMTMIAAYDTALQKEDEVEYFDKRYRLSPPSRFTFGGQVVGVSFTLEKIR